MREVYSTIVELAAEEPDSVYGIAKEILSRSESGNHAHLGTGYLGLAEAYYYLHSYDSARIAYTNAIASYGAIGDTLRMASCYNVIGLIDSDKAEYKTALDAYESALNLYKKIGDKDGIATCFQNIGVIYAEWGFEPKANDYYERSLKLFRELNDSLSVANLTNNIGNFHKRTGTYEQALKYYKESYLTFKRLGDLYGLASVTTNLGSLFVLQEQWDRCLEYYFEAIELYRKVGNDLGISYVYTSIGVAFFNQEKVEKSLGYFLKAERVADSLGYKELKKENLNNIYEVYKTLGDFEKANAYLIDFYALKDSIYSEENFNKLVELEKKYQIEKSQKEVLALKARDEKRELILWALFVIFVMAAVIGFVIFKIQRIKERQHRLILEQKILLTQMNPHFMFNSLSALQCLIMDEKPDEAVDFVAEFAGLMRLVLQYSKEEVISLKKEEEILNYYISLQNRRFSHKIEYRIEMDPSLQLDKVLVPPMLAQPFVENAIEHGELSEQEESQIKVSFSRKNDNLEFMIEDNGIGLKNARAKNRRSTHKSMAMDITRERIKLLYQNSSAKALDLLVEDLSEYGSNGTRVKFHIPYQELN